jgi:peroxiredoxin
MRRMRKALPAAGVILGAILAAAAFAAPPSIVGRQAPDFVLRGLDGRNLRLSEFRGQVVLVNFWTRSDGDSRQQMPALDRINVTYQRAGLVVLGVSVDDDLRRSKEFATAMGVSYPILFDTGTDLGKDYFLQKMPMTILVDRSGVVRYSAVGYRRGDERIYLDQIRELLRE